MKKILIQIQSGADELWALLEADEAYLLRIMEGKRYLSLLPADTLSFTMSPGQGEHRLTVSEFATDFGVDETEREFLIAPDAITPDKLLHFQVSAPLFELCATGVSLLVAVKSHGDTYRSDPIPWADFLTYTGFELLTDYSHKEIEMKAFDEQVYQPIQKALQWIESHLD